MGIGKDVPTERVVSGQSSEFREELIAVDVVVPGRGHRLLESAGVVLTVASGSNAFDAAELRQGVDTMCL